MVGALGRRGLLLGGAGRRTPCAERAVMLTAVQSLRLLVRRGACWEGSGRRTPCAERAVMLTAVQSLRRARSEGARWEGAGRRTPCAERAVIAHSSPEPAAACNGEGRVGSQAGRPCHFWGVCGEGLVGALRAQGEL